MKLWDLQGTKLLWKYGDVLIEGKCERIEIEYKNRIVGFNLREINLKMTSVCLKLMGSQFPYYFRSYEALKIQIAYDMMQLDARVVQLSHSASLMNDSSNQELTTHKEEQQIKLITSRTN